MDFILGLLFTILGTVIEGAYGMFAWNMAIPKIFEGVPEITLVQSIAIAFVASLITYGGTVSKEEFETDSAAVKGLYRILMILVVSTMMLICLWIIVKFFL